MSITVRNRQRKLHIDCAALQQFAERVLSKLANHSLGQIDVLLISDRRMAALHRQFMNIAGPTDVITFQHGEIFISTETAKRNARRFQKTFENEVKLYLVHGLLHLYGYDDTTPKETKRMEEKQQRLFKSACGAV